MHFIRSIISLIAFVSCMGQAAAQTTPISGADDTEFLASIDAWLAGDDLSALQELARLAADGNHAAQILLASIATRGSLHTHVTTNLSRNERVALLRMPGGLSGKSWLTAAESAEPLATALQQSTNVTQRTAAVAALLDLGEAETALIAAQAMLFNGNAQELIDVMIGRDSNLPPEASIILIWALADADPNTPPYQGSENSPDDRLVTKHYAWTPPSLRDLVEDSDFRAEMIGRHDQIPSWTPILNFCERNCPETAGACTALGASMNAAGPFPMRSPLMSLIPNETYWTSPRIDGDLARTTLNLSELDHDWMATVDACYVDAMVTAQATHGYSK